MTPHGPERGFFSFFQPVFLPCGDRGGAFFVLYFRLWESPIGELERACPREARMYIEIFILDNFLMDLLILRLAAALLEVRPPLFRQTGAALISALIAALAAYRFPALLSPLLRAPQLALLALGLPVKNLRGFLKALGITLLSTLTAGGCVIAAAFIAGGGTEGAFGSGGIPLGAALSGAAAASFLPLAARRMLIKRIPKALAARLVVIHGGMTYTFAAMTDTGNRLREPSSGLPVAVVRSAALYKAARLPIPTLTPAGSAVLWGFKPEAAFVNGVRTELVIAVTREKLPAEAIIPPEAAPEY